MKREDKIVKLQSLATALVAELAGSDAQKSSHWQRYTSSRQVTSEGSISGISGFGARATRTWLHQTVHSVLQRRVLGPRNPIFSSQFYRSAIAYTRAQRRALDMDVLRHVCTLELLCSYHRFMGCPETVAVIGDGQTNFVAAALASGLYKKIVSINLADVLLSDLGLLERLHDLGEYSVGLATDQETLVALLADDETRVILVPAHRAILLGICGLDLVVNIASFQEMTPQIVKEYFGLMRTNRAWHYNCNRLRKVLPAGEVLDFLSWDWTGADLIIDSLCPWHQHWYTYSPPFIRPYDGPIQHRLAKFN